MLLTRTIDHFASSGMQTYFEYEAIPQSTGGLQAAGTIVIPWSVDRADLVMNAVELKRGKEHINLLRASDLTVIRREAGLEQARLDGLRSVVMSAKDLQVGDRLKVAATYRIKPLMPGKMEQIHNWSAKVPIRLLQRRFIVPDGVQMAWKRSSLIPEPHVLKANGGTHYVFSAADFIAPQLPKYVPDRIGNQLIQFTNYQNWGEVAQPLTPLFERARKLAEGSPIKAEADRIASASSNPAARMLAALRVVQDKVRYVAVLLGEGAYTPTSADETWTLKYGDCKGKTALLLGLLDQLNVKAEPVLASVNYDDGLNDRLPSLGLFDHVLVRATVAGATYYLDATNYGQRTLEEVRSAPVQWGLPLVAGRTLEEFAQLRPTQPTTEFETEWNATKVTGEETPFTVRLTLRGATASLMRAKAAAATDQQALDKSLRDLVPAIANDALTIKERRYDEPDGRFEVTFAGSATMDWTPFEGKREARYQFDETTSSWKVDFERDSGKWKELPVTVGSYEWQRQIETIILPGGGKGYVVEGDSLDRQIGGTEIKRTATLHGDRATAISDFRTAKREISAEEARSAQKQLAELNDDLAWIVKKR